MFGVVAICAHPQATLCATFVRSGCLVVSPALQVDQFTNVHDFARAYGSLCWNLSKVIPRKDLPRYQRSLPC